MLDRKYAIILCHKTDVPARMWSTVTGALECKKTGARSYNKWPCVQWVWNHITIIFTLLMEMNEDCHICRAMLHINKAYIRCIHCNVQFCVGYSRNSHMLSPSPCIISLSVTYLPERLSTPTMSIRSIVIQLTFHAVKNFL